MSITSDRIREREFIHCLADAAAEEIEELEKAYELLFRENSDNCKRIAELEADVEKLAEALRANSISWPSANALATLDEYDKKKGGA